MHSKDYPGKHLFDKLGAAILLLILSPFILLVAGYMVIKRDLPILFSSERMRGVDAPFTLHKFRTMRNLSEGEVDTGVSGGNKASRITPLGHALRSKRLDELPQLLNVIAGDISLVGPRPPLRRYTEMFPDLYGAVLRSRPGITGLASVMFHRHEEWLIKGTSTAAETEEIYVKRCIPRKARIDLIAQKNASLGLDLYVLYLTAAKFLSLPGRRAKRVRAQSRKPLTKR